LAAAQGDAFAKPMLATTVGTLNSIYI